MCLGLLFDNLTTYLLLLQTTFFLYSAIRIYLLPKNGEVAKISLQGNDIWLLKPDTFMNRSGLAVKSLLSFYQLTPEQLLVAHDEIDLPPGITKLKKQEQ